MQLQRGRDALAANMKCPNCNTNFTHENQLTLVENSHGRNLPWYLPAARNRLACPQCGATLKHRPASLMIAAFLGCCFLLCMSLEIVYPDNEDLGKLFWISTIALACNIPLLMLSKSAFLSDGDQVR